jgi:hypothetical protein
MLTTADLKMLCAVLPSTADRAALGCGRFPHVKARSE